MTTRSLIGTVESKDRRGLTICLERMEGTIRVQKICECGHGDVGDTATFLISERSGRERTVTQTVCSKCVAAKKITAAAASFAPTAVSLTLRGEEREIEEKNARKLSDKEREIVSLSCWGFSNIYAPTERNLAQGAETVTLWGLLAQLCKEVVRDAGVAEITATVIENSKKILMELEEEKKAIESPLRQKVAEMPESGSWRYGQDRDGDYQEWVSGNPTWDRLASLEQKMRLNQISESIKMLKEIRPVDANKLSVEFRPYGDRVTMYISFGEVRLSESYYRSSKEGAQNLLDQFVEKMDTITKGMKALFALVPKSDTKPVQQPATVVAAPVPAPAKTTVVKPAAADLEALRKKFSSR